MHYRTITMITLVFVLFTSTLFAQNPGAHWQMYATPEEAGWSAEKLEEAEAYANEIGTAAFMVIQDGKVVDYWGDIDRRFMCHSIRKSFLSALMGVYVDQGIIDLSTTMEQLGIEDVHQLTDQEKQATIGDLLKARSGVYHPAAYETDAMKARRPERGTYKPNTFWYYNNWDFNTLCHILMMYSKKDFFLDFKERFADPLQLEDFRLEDTYYHLEAEHSQFPAYPFRMSSRDLARFGQLFLQEGQWNGGQIVSADWVAESTRSYSIDTRAKDRGYAYLWWTNIYGTERPNYSAQGVGNQAIIVYPEENVVLVNRANTFEGERVDTDDLIELTKKVFAAKNGTVKEMAKVKPLPHELDEYTGPFRSDWRHMVITRKGDRLLADSRSGKFYLDPVPGSEDTFFIEDLERMIAFLRDEDGELTGELKIED